MTAHSTRLLAISTLLLGTMACSPTTPEPADQQPAQSSAMTPDKPAEPDKPSEPGVPTTPEPPQELETLHASLKAASAITAADLIAAHMPAYEPTLGYEPLRAANLDLIETSSLKLTPGQRTKLQENGFVISTAQGFPSFGYGYKTIYAEDLPVYISADSILFALHRSFDDILKHLELAQLAPALNTLLTQMHDGLAQRPQGSTDHQDMDFFLAVARALLSGQSAATLDASLQARVDAVLKKAQSADGMETMELFGARRRVDFSQFKPRGHYTESEQLERYFRAMTWLGRIDLRMLEPNESGELIFHRRQAQAAALMQELVAEHAQTQWDLIESVLATIMGEQDNMTLSQLEELEQDLGISALGDWSTIPEARVSKHVQTGAYGKQKIASHIMINGTKAATLPLSASVLLFGQRYVFDSHVLSNVVFDRVLVDGKPARMMPSPLDAAFATFDNKRALQLLEPELTEYGYAGHLNAMHFMAGVSQVGWDANFYHSWLGALRSLNDEDLSAKGLPAVAKTRAWGTRMLNTQLASWAELRRDTILYAKQSYTAGAACEFPDAYVEPYPAFWAKMSELASKGQALGEQVQDERVQRYFVGFGAAMDNLEEMAIAQRNGTPFTPQQMTFINRIVSVELHGCTEEDSELVGWYGDLFFDPSHAGALAYEPTIADVHTQPTDAAGSPVGKVLHVGTDKARPMIITLETCEGPRAYVGLTSSYYEHITSDFKRLNDEEWSMQLSGASPPEETPWMRDIQAD